MYSQCALSVWLQWKLRNIKQTDSNNSHNTVFSVWLQSSYIKPSWFLPDSFFFFKYQFLNKWCQCVYWTAECNNTEWEPELEKQNRNIFKSSTDSICSVFSCSTAWRENYVRLIILLLGRDNVCVLFLTLGGLSASQSGVSAHTERKSQTNFLDWYQSLKAIKKSFVSIKMAAHHTQRKCCLLYFNHSPLSVIMVLLFPPGFPV